MHGARLVVPRALRPNPISEQQPALGFADPPVVVVTRSADDRSSVPGGKTSLARRPLGDTQSGTRYSRVPKLLARGAGARNPRRRCMAAPYTPVVRGPPPSSSRRHGRRHIGTPASHPWFGGYTPTANNRSAPPPSRLSRRRQHFSKCDDKYTYSTAVPRVSEVVHKQVGPGVPRSHGSVMYPYGRARPGLGNDLTAPAHHTTTTTSLLLRCVPAVTKTNASETPASRPPPPASLLPPLLAEGRPTPPFAHAEGAVGHGGDGRSAREAAGRALDAPPRAVGAPAAAAASTPPRGVALGGCVGRPRSPPLVVRVSPQGRCRRRRRRDRGAPCEAHGPSARRGRPASRAPQKSSPAPAAPTAQGEGARARAHGAASTSHGAAAGGRRGQAVEAAGAHPAAAGRAVVVMAGGADPAVEAAQAGPFLRCPGAGGDRGGHLRADGRPAAAAAEEAAARRTAAARFALPRALAGRGHRRRLQGARRRVAELAPSRRRRRAGGPASQDR